MLAAWRQQGWLEELARTLTGLRENKTVNGNKVRADSCQKMKIQDWDAALYERGELSYLCWTYSPEVSYILEYSPYAFADEEIIKMAESAKPINEE